MSELVTTTEAANELNVTRRWVVELIRRGHLNAERHGRDYIIRRDDLEQYKRERNTGDEQR